MYTYKTKTKNINVQTNKSRSMARNCRFFGLYIVSAEKWAMSGIFICIYNILLCAGISTN